MTIKPRKGTLKVGVMVYMTPEELERLDAAIGSDQSRTAWIVEACREKLAREQSPERTETNA